MCRFRHFWSRVSQLRALQYVFDSILIVLLVFFRPHNLRQVPQKQSFLLSNDRKSLRWRVLLQQRLFFCLIYLPVSYILNLGKCLLFGMLPMLTQLVSTLLVYFRGWFVHFFFYQHSHCCQD